MGQKGGGLFGRNIVFFGQTNPILFIYSLFSIHLFCTIQNSTMRRLIIYFLYLMIPMFSSAQPICQITDFTAENGLPQDIASAVLQDQKGFIWICTRNGLNKFDGYTFKNYKSAPHKEYTLSNNRITFISETAYGDIWCQTYDSKAYIFDTHLEIFYDVLQTVDKLSLIHI